jgi:hypothetical protein
VIEILISGVSLGVYVPGLLVRERLRALGVAARVVVYESFIAPERQARIDAAKRAYHERLAFALAGQRLARQLSPEPHEELLGPLFARWERSPPSALVALSGYWVPVVARWAGGSPERAAAVDLLHMDSTLAPSWRTFGSAGLRDVWLFSAEERRVRFRLPVSGGDVPFGERGPRVVVHGGGWGIGHYEVVVPDLVAHGYEVDLAAYFPEDLRPAAGVRHLFLDPAWKPWLPGEDGEPGFPPSREVAAAWNGESAPARDRHPLYDRIASAAAVVSKPGGATLVDSFAAATPIVFLPPYGDHEQQNAELWEELGFGLSFEAWRDTGFARGPLEALHRNLREARRHTPSYPDELAARLDSAPKHS